MNMFLLWFERSDELDGVTKAGIAHLWFLTVHPFEDGNGRMARAIADMLLARDDGISDRFYGMSAQIEHERKDYYLQLEKQQRNTPDITNWLDWFFDCFKRTIEKAEKTLGRILFNAKL